MDLAQAGEEWECDDSVLQAKGQVMVIPEPDQPAMAELSLENS